MKIKIALVAIAFAALVGCGESKENQIMPKEATTDAVYSEKASQYLEEVLGTPKKAKDSLKKTF